MQDSMAEITVRAWTGHVTCVKEFRAVEVDAAAQYRSHTAELSGFAQARCASDAD
ncbi:hypothetical protein ACGFY3_00890 [Streptomyces mirabilis]|jgi:hypothetical protein|nr:MULTISPECIES: hypothetical protein [Streptomyces]MCT9105692.1 hypothetical protein [Streptomyces mirabilis]MCX4436384.1 hypothetical protein [Streptomyces mirabilis]